MKSKLQKALLIVFVSIGVAAIALISVSTAIQDAYSRNYSNKYNQLYNKFYAIGTVYLSFGAGNETQKALYDFMSVIPGDFRVKNNVVIADKSGHVLFKANSNFIHTESNQITMAWDRYAVIFDQNTGEKYWVDGGNESIAEIDSGYIRTIGTERIKLTQEELRTMIDAYRNVDRPESKVEITFLGDQKSPVYMFWFRNLGAGEAISRSFGTNHYRVYSYMTSAGLVLLLLYWLLAPVWVFLEARKRQIQPLPWALLILLTNIVGLIVYWIAQTQNTKVNPALACPSCGNGVHKNHLYCPWCATPLVKTCKSCGKTLEQDWTACPWCGAKVEQVPTES